MFIKKSIFRTFFVLIAVLMMSGIASARPLEALLGTGFTYQGKLTDGGAPTNGTYDFEFTLYDDLSAGSHVGSPVTLGDVTVTNGLFTVQLDFGDVFDGTALYLEIFVRPGASVGGYTALAPRQPLSATPYAIYASNSPWSGLSGVPAGFADGTDDGTLYTAGSGLTLAGSEFSVTGVPWSGVTGVPAGFADGVDNGTIYTAGSGLALNGVEFSVTGAPWSGLTGVPAGFADGVDNDTTAWSGLTGMPAGFADGVDDNTTYTAGDGLELVGTQFKGKGTSYQNVVIVAKSGGDFTTITAALNAITTASDTNRYLIYIAPGVYNERVTMKLYVDIEGAGELTTRITFTGSTSPNTGTVLGANDAELRFLTVENTGSAANAIAIYNNLAAPRLTHVTASVLGGAYNYGVYNSSSSPTMTDVIASASGGTKSYGVHNEISSPAMTNVSVSASGGTNANYGVYNNSSSSLTMTDVSASASGGVTSYGVLNNSSSPTMTNVTASASGGTNANYGVYNNSSSSLTMTDVSAIASGGSYNYGVYNSFSSPTMTNVTASATGGNSSYGVFNSYSSPTMTNVSTSASGGINNFGVYNDASSPTINNSVISGSDGLYTYGIYNYATSSAYTVLVNNSQISGSTNTIVNDSEFTTRIGASQLSGGAIYAGGGTVTCIGVYDENYVSPGYTTCP